MRISKSISGLTAAALAATAVQLLVLFAASTAGAQEAQKLQLDEQASVNGVDAACTGIGSDSRTDPRWNGYPLRIELTGTGGQYLGEARVSAAQDGKDVVALTCGGPWVLLRLKPGAYRVSATVEGVTVTENANVSDKGQGRIILRFATGGALSKEHIPATN